MRAKRLARSIASFATAGAVISVVAVPDAVARSSYPYCAMSRGADMGYQDCSYATFAACLEDILGSAATASPMRAMCRRRSHLSGIAGTRAGRGSAISRFLRPRADSTPKLAANRIGQ